MVIARVLDYLLGNFRYFRPKTNKNMTLQVRIPEIYVHKITDAMNKYGITSYSKYIRKLIESDIDFIE